MAVGRKGLDTVTVDGVDNDETAWFTAWALGGDGLYNPPSWYAISLFCGVNFPALAGGGVLRLGEVVTGCNCVDLAEFARAMCESSLGVTGLPVLTSCSLPAVTALAAAARAGGGAGAGAGAVMG